MDVKKGRHITNDNMGFFYQLSNVISICNVNETIRAAVGVTIEGYFFGIFENVAGDVNEVLDKGKETSGLRRR